MLYGVVAEIPRIATAANTGVHFDGTTSISLASMASADSYDFSFFGFFRMANWQVGYHFLWGIAPETSEIPTSMHGNTTALSFDASDAAASSSKKIQFETSDPAEAFWTPPIGNNVWVPIIGSVNTNAGTDSKPIKMYFSDQDVLPNGSVTDGSIAFQVKFSGQSFWVGDDSFGDFFEGDIFNLSIWPGVSFLTAGDIDVTTRRRFYDASFAPASPSIAIAQYGTPAFMLTGGASTFMTNSLGSEGPLSLISGSLSDVAGP